LSPNTTTALFVITQGAMCGSPGKMLTPDPAAFCSKLPFPTIFVIAVEMSLEASGRGQVLVAAAPGLPTGLMCLRVCEGLSSRGGYYLRIPGTVNIFLCSMAQADRVRNREITQWISYPQPSPRGSLAIQV
jgi:hypothetical protein